MRITPIEIRQKEFEKNFRGYDKDEVNAFLQTLSQEWERVLEDSREMRYKQETTQREVEKLREVESSLFKTLKTAEDTGASMIEQAGKTAELQVRESSIKAEEILSQARERAKSIVEKAEEKTRQIMVEMHERVKELRFEYKETQEDLDELVFKIKNLAIDTLKRVEKTEGNIPYDIDQKVEEAQQIIEEYHAEAINRKSELEREDRIRTSTSSYTFDSNNDKNVSEPARRTQPEPETVENDHKIEDKPTRSRSFFDDIE